MPKTLIRNGVIASLACVVAFSACQPKQPQGAESSGLAELNDESLDEATVTSEVVSSTESVAPAEPQTTTTTKAPAAVSSTAVETTLTLPETTSSSVAETTSTVLSTTSAAPQTTSTTATTASTTSTIATPTTTEATTTTTIAESTTTSMPMSSSYYSIDISGFSFAPSALTIRVGDTVTWTNLDSAIHTVTFSGSASLSSSGLQEGDTHSASFDAVGTYTYICSPHPSMQGTIIVTE